MSHRRRAWLLAILAPGVAAGALLLGGAWWVFALYHGGCCLLAPAVLARRAGRSWRQHARDLGLVAPRPGGWRIGGALAVACAAAPPVGAWLWPDLFPAADRLWPVLTGWGLTPATLGAALAFLAVGGAAAEELLWRGWLPTRLGRGRRPLVAAVALVLLFGSYHGVTLARLAPGTAATAVMLAGVVLAAGVWSGLRWRWRSVWPPLLGHVGAACGYALVAAARLG